MQHSKTGRLLTCVGQNQTRRLSEAIRGPDRPARPGDFRSEAGFWLRPGVGRPSPTAHSGGRARAGMPGAGPQPAQDAIFPLPPHCGGGSMMSRLVSRMQPEDTNVPMGDG